MNIPILVERFSRNVQKVLAIFGEIIALIFGIVILVFGGVQITSLAMGQMTSSLGIAVGIFYVVMPISGVLMAIYAVMNMIDIIKGNIPLGSVREVKKEVQ